jgi:hypothetical protein
MTFWIAAAAGLVAVGAAARSTWSPCGLSMLSTITPVAERGKGHRYGATASWFVLGAVAGGVTLGVVMALLAAAVRSGSIPPTTLGLVALAAALVAVASDAGIAGVRVPVHRRQVNERWLDRYRPWVYGAGFGWQIGVGVATYITTAAVYLMVVLAALTGRPVVAVALGAGFGLLRGLAVLLTRHLTTPSALRAFHRRFTDRGPALGRLVIAFEATGAVVLLGSLHSLAAVVLALGAGAAVALLRVAGMPGRPGPGRASVGFGEGRSTARRTDRGGDDRGRDVGEQGGHRGGLGVQTGAGLRPDAAALTPPPPLQGAESADQQDDARSRQGDARPLDEQRTEVPVLAQP